MPPADVAVQVYVVPLESVLSVVASQPVWLDTALSASVTVHVTPTFEVYQPLLPSVPVTVGAIAGGVASAGGGGSETSCSDVVIEKLEPAVRRSAWKMSSV